MSLCEIGCGLEYTVTNNIHYVMLAVLLLVLLTRIHHTNTKIFLNTTVFTDWNTKYLQLLINTKYFEGIVYQYCLTVTRVHVPWGNGCLNFIIFDWIWEKPPSMHTTARHTFHHQNYSCSELLYILTNNSGRYWCWKLPRLLLLWLVSRLLRRPWVLGSPLNGYISPWQTESWL